jgi:hypothetical protein
MLLIYVLIASPSVYTKEISPNELATLLISVIRVLATYLNYTANGSVPIHYPVGTIAVPNIRFSGILITVHYIADIEAGNSSLATTPITPTIIKKALTIINNIIGKFFSHLLIGFLS